MENLKFESKNELLEYARKAIGNPIGMYDVSNRLATGKGAVGTVMEEGYFGYKPNSNSVADFEDLGVELKVTPFTRTRNGISAKERLVCNIIDYMSEYRETFETSSFMKKCSSILLMLYEHIESKSKSEFEIDEVALFSYPLEDLVIIRDDWEKIISKVRNGKAHEISESDTLYLGACTKGANAKSLRPQPFSKTLAMQRAYALKSSYMTYVLREYIYGNKKSESILKYPNQLEELTFEQWIQETVKPYLGKDVDSLCNELGVENRPKNLNEIILSKIFGLKGRISKTSEFQKANIVPKTIRVRKDGHIVESMSFPTFKFLDIVNQEWEDSDLYEYLTQTKFLFVVFKESENEQLFLSKLQFWNMAAHDLEEVRLVWKRTKQVVCAGVELTEVKGRIKNNLPKSDESRVAHVRSHAKNALDTYPLPDGRAMTKQCFWLNNTYILSQLED